MKRWIAGLIGGLALTGMAVTGAVFAAPFVTVASDSAPKPAASTWSPAPIAVAPTPEATASAEGTGAAKVTESVEITGGEGTDSTEIAVDPSVPSADNPWPEGVLIPDELNAKILAAETALVTACMAAQGFDYLAPSPANTSMYPPDLTDEEAALYQVALYGHWTDTYDWETAGCYGAAVHALGMDNAH